jgi:hypothetical protein
VRQSVLEEVTKDSESDGISPTITGRMTCAIIYKSNSPPDMLNGTRNGLLQLKHRKRKY